MAANISQETWDKIEWSMMITGKVERGEIRLLMSDIQQIRHLMEYKPESIWIENLGWIADEAAVPVKIFVSDSGHPIYIREEWWDVFQAMNMLLHHATDRQIDEQIRINQQVIREWKWKDTEACEDLREALRGAFKMLAFWEKEKRSRELITIRGCRQFRGMDF